MSCSHAACVHVASASSPSPYGPTQRARRRPISEWQRGRRACLPISSRCLAEAGSATPRLDAGFSAPRCARQVPMSRSRWHRLGNRKLRTLVSVPPQPARDAQSATQTIQLHVARMHGRYAAPTSIGCRRGVRIPRLRVFLVNGMRAAARYAKRTYSVEAELVFVALVLLAWHAIRIPIEGDVTTSLAHADDVLRLERALSLDVRAQRSSAPRRCECDACSRVALHEHPPTGAVRIRRRRAPARSRSLPPSSARRSRWRSCPRRSSSGSIRLPLRTGFPRSASALRRPTPS